MGGDGGDGGDGGGDGSDGSDGGVGDGGVSDNTGSSDSGSFSLSDFGGFGDNASQANAAAAQAAQTGMATGVDSVSATGFGAFGPTDAPTGNDPANTPGFGAFADASLGPGVGYGDIGGFGVPGFGTGISGFGGIGGFGSGAPGAPGGFGNIGVGTANDSIASAATGMGLGINDSTDANTTAAQIASLGPSIGAALGTLGENIGTPAQVAQAATPASPVAAINTAANINSVTGLQDAPITGVVPTVSVPVSMSIPPTTMDAELGLTSPVNAPTTAEGLGVQASNIAAQNVAMNQNEGFNAIDAAANTSQPSLTAGNFNIGIGSPSTAASVGTGQTSSPGVSVAATPAASAPATATSGQSVSAALANAIGSETGFGAIGSGLNFTNPAGSILLAQYPWLGFQPATS